MSESRKPSQLSVLAARVAALEELLSVHEEVVMEQSGRLERTLSELRGLNAELERRVRERTLELSGANRALMEQVERWRVTLASIGDAVIVTDVRSVIVTLNATAERLTGWSAGTAAGRRLDEVFVTVSVETGLPAGNPARLPLKSGAAGLANHTLLIAADGARREIDASAAPIVDDRGDVLGVVLVFHDISERREMEREREETLQREREARRRSESLNRAKDDFLSVLSHELRTPLTAIAGWTALMRSGRLDAGGMRKAMEVIERSVGAQTRLITDLLDVSSMLAGKITLERRPVELSDLTHAATEVLRPVAAAAGIDLTVSGSGEPMVVNGDSQRLQQVVHNLVDNAIKFTPRGGTVRVSVARQGEEASISVQDTGAGIDPEFLPHIFERFSQADSTVRRRYKGLGLGLSIVRHLVELHGGYVNVKSDGVNSGSTFTVSLPLVLAEVEEAPGSGVAEHTAVRATRLDGLRILLVEDDPDTREMIAETLKRFGALVSGTQDAVEALAEFDRFQPHLFIGDIGLPGQDGFQMMRSIRARGPERGGDVPAIALTAYVRPEDRAHAIASGYQRHLAKPVNITELTSSVRELAVNRKT